MLIMKYTYGIQQMQGRKTAGIVSKEHCSSFLKISLAHYSVAE